MASRTVLGLAAAALAALILVLLLPVRPESREELIRAEMPGDVDEVVARFDPEELPARARAFLATDRPWRASRAMDRHLEIVTDTPAEVRILAARAHAGWGDWDRALVLLRGIPELESYEDGLGSYLLARALDESGNEDGAIAAYRAYLAYSPPAGEREAERRAARLRLALALIRSGAREEGEAELDAVRVATSLEGFEAAAAWLRILRADALAAAGDTAAVRAAVAGFDSGLRGLRAWRARVAAAHRAVDVAGARSLANRARDWARTTDTRAEFLLRAGELALEMGDAVAARDAFRSVIAMNAAGHHARAAAARLREGRAVFADHLAIARVLTAQGLHEDALEHFQTWLDAERGSAAERAEVHLEHATALFYSERYDEVRAALEPLAGRTPARLLLARAEARRGREEVAAGIYLEVAADHGASATGREALFLAASTYHDAGERRRARELYHDVIRRYSGSDRAGLAMMRLAGLAFADGEHEAAARIWDEYRRRYPRGDRAMQAAYWSARARTEMGDSAGAADLFRRIREEDRTSYYGLLASARLREPFWPVPLARSPEADPAAERRVAVWLRALDLFRDAGHGHAASALADELAARTGLDRATRYALAEGLADRGYSQRAIRIGIGLQGAGPPDRRLLRILYPFPYRTLITEEARDRDLDPFIAAALIRQESMFEPRITSPAGARGLMQIMPGTGRRLAQAAGMEEWDAEMLYHPEINVHLGIRYVAQHMETYDRSLPSVFAAYNAGAHRVGWWSGFPEYRDDELFTERIPFRETRNYVKILTLNRALYDGLHSGGAGP